jgi:uncharacterized membrane protein
MKVDAPKRSLAKTLSWRFISLLIVFFVSLFITQSAKYAVSISIGDSLIKLFAYYFHERYWTTIRWGRKKHKKNKKNKKHKKDKKHKKPDTDL